MNLSGRIERAMRHPSAVGYIVSVHIAVVDGAPVRSTIKFNAINPAGQYLDTELIAASEYKGTPGSVSEALWVVGDLISRAKVRLNVR